MRLVRILIALCCVAAGVIVGALNPQRVSLDVGLSVLHGTLGVSLLTAMLAGALLGGLVVAAAVVIPLQQRLRRERRGRSLPNDSGIA